MTPLRIIALLSILMAPALAGAQTDINLGGIAADPTAPVEVTADSLTVDQATGTAIFTGNVLIGQGDLRVAAEQVQVVYDGETGDITRLLATGNVTFVTETEAAEAEAADYNLRAGTLIMTGNVLLTQGASAISAERMTVNLTEGTAQMDGRVRTVFQQQGAD